MYSPFRLLPQVFSRVWVLTGRVQNVDRLLKLFLFILGFVLLVVIILGEIFLQLSNRGLEVLF